MTEPVGDHRYVSTACFHELHDRCRLTCKFCETECRCGCHQTPPVIRAQIRQVFRNYEQMREEG